MKPRVFSGIRATGRLHLGNYMGAIKGMKALQDKYDCIFSVVDLHTITTPYDPTTLQQNIKDVVLDYLGAGLDVKKCHLMLQSSVREHVELAYLLGTIYPVSRLEDLPTYKDKKLQHENYINMGLLYYPVLMAADILLYKAEKVPVGIDQEPHIEVTREIARKFNTVYGETFPEPVSFATTAPYVPSLLGQGKMSKSVEGSYINLTDSLEVIKAKIAKTPTDSGHAEKFPEEGAVVNLMAFVELFQGHDRAQQYRQQYKNEGLRYGEIKEELAKAIFSEIEPLQMRRAEYEKQPEKVVEILEQGREYAESIAKETMAEVKSKMGLI